MLIAPKFWKELSSAPDDVVSSAIANTETMQFKWTLQEDLLFKNFHVDKPLTKLTRSLGARLPDIIEEAQMAISAYLGPFDDWKAIPVSDSSFKVIARTANRLFFGPELARNEEFLKLSIEYTTILFGGANLIKNYPGILKTLVLRWRTDIVAANRLAKKHLAPVFKARMAEKKRYADQGQPEIWDKMKPDDSVQWVLDASPPEELNNLTSLTNRMLHINVAAVHTSTDNFLNTMQVLSLMPELQQELREEILEIFTRDGGWTKQTLAHLKKVDSVMTETARYCPGASTRTKRRVIKDFRLSDGTLIPRGLTVFWNSAPYATDPEAVENGDKFDPLRFYKMRLEPGQENQHQWVMFSQVNTTFGTGRHACPGRFFAANEVKTVLVLFLMRYEWRMASNHTIQDIFQGTWHNELRAARQDVVLEFKSLAMEMPEILKGIF
ncbi:hypothetical protein BHE90_013839 [Fusarium euwallaceae]|uniref:Uncharacterized protein n=1 Tax=Fusarium euwallaceae TaxID=1147111 RepID=A0A430L7Q9_9HYPO|nr:hypothetical protein BHE90_013839 [Fusarium euwallaceae]